MWDFPDFLGRHYRSGFSGPVAEYQIRNREVAGSTRSHPVHCKATLSKLLTYCVLSSGQLSFLPSAGREMSSSYGYGVTA